LVLTRSRRVRFAANLASPVRRDSIAEGEGEGEKERRREEKRKEGGSTQEKEEESNSSPVPHFAPPPSLVDPWVNS